MGSEKCSYLTYSVEDLNKYFAKVTGESGGLPEGETLQEILAAVCDGNYSILANFIGHMYPRGRLERQFPRPSQM